jgi:hypothetical protein
VTGSSKGTTLTDPPPNKFPNMNRDVDVDNDDFRGKKALGILGG